MADRRDLQKELNRINELYHEKDLELQKAGGSIEQRQMMRDMLNKKKEALIAEMGDDLQKLNIGSDIKIARGAGKEAGDKVASKLAKTLGKRALGALVPGVGAASLASDILGTEAVASGTDMGLTPDQQMNIEASRAAQKEDKMTPERFRRMREMLSAGPQTIPGEQEVIPAPSMQQMMGGRPPMSPEKIRALTGVDQMEEAKARLEQDSMDEGSERERKLRKLFQGQLGGR